MSKYKFNIDPNEPGDDAVNRHKDFGRVMQNYQRMTNPLYRTPLYRYRRVFLSVLLVLLCVWLVAEFGDEKPETQNDAKKDSLRKDSLMKQRLP